MSKSSALMDETPIMFQPSLAKLVGLHEAIVLQTLRFWCGNKKSGKIIDGERWIYNSAAEWRELSFPFWSTKTIGDIFLTLERMGLVKSAQFDLKEGKARKYYTLTQSALTVLTIEKANQLEESSDTMWKNVLGDVEDSSRSARARLIKQYTENLTENTKPPTPLQGEVESSPMGSHSTDGVVELTAQASAADAEVGETFVSDSIPPNSVKPITGAERRKSPPIDQAKLAAFKTRANKIFRRRETTPWSASEERAAKLHLDTPDSEWELLEKYYANSGQKGFYCRTTMATFLNNFAGEIDRAKAKFPDEENDPDFWNKWKPRD
jgi:DNA-binding PadR family transcriptional regulator